MTTSGVTAWELTATQLVKAAMEEGGIIQPDTDPDADELVTGIRKLNGYLKSLQLNGVMLAREQTLAVATVAATASVTLSAGVRAVSSVRHVVSATNERRLWPMQRTDYLSLPNKTQAGNPSMYYLDRQRDAAVLYLWPVSASIINLKLDYDKITETIIAGTETLDIRSEYNEAIWTNLGFQLCQSFGVPIPPGLAERAMRLEMQMLDAERPDSYRFETDYEYSDA